MPHFYVNGHKNSPCDVKYSIISTSDIFTGTASASVVRCLYLWAKETARFPSRLVKQKMRFVSPVDLFWELVLSELMFAWEITSHIIQIPFGMEVCHQKKRVLKLCLHLPQVMAKLLLLLTQCESWADSFQRFWASSQEKSQLHSQSLCEQALCWEPTIAFRQVAHFTNEKTKFKKARSV